MSKTYKTGFVITGDASGGVNALKMTRAEMDHLNATQKKSQGEWGNTNKAQRQAADTARLVEQQYGALDKSLSNTMSLVSGLAGALAAFGAAQQVNAIVRETEQLERNLLRTEQLIQSTGRAASTSAEELHQQARELALATLGSTEGIMEAQQILMTFKNVSVSSFDEVTERALDLATVTGVGLSGSMTQLAKALENPVQGINAMTRSGVSFSQAQKDVIKSLVETGDVAAAQRIILNEVAAQYGGVAKKEALGLAGAQDTLGQSIQETRIALGQQSGILDIMAKSTNTLAASIMDLTAAYKAGDLDMPLQILGFTAIAVIGRYTGMLAANTVAVGVNAGKKRDAALKEIQLAQAQVASTATALRSAQVQAAMGAGHLQAAKAADAHTAALARLAVAQQGVGSISRGLLGLMGGPAGLAVTVGLTALAFVDFGRSAETAAKSSDMLSRSLTSLDSRQTSLAIQQASEKLKTYQSDLAAAQNKYNSTMQQIRSNRDSTRNSALEQMLLEDGAALSDAGDQVEIYQQKLDELNNHLKELRSNNGKPITPPVDPEQEKAIAQMTDRLVEQYMQLQLGERAYLTYQLAQQNATLSQTEQALAAFDAIEALKAQRQAEADALKAQENNMAAYAAALSSSTKSSIQSLDDVGTQAQKVWAALAAGKISSEQAAAAIDGLAAAGAGVVDEQQKWIDQMIAAMDPARDLEEQIRRISEAQAEGLFGDLDDSKVADYLDALKKKLEELNGIQVDPLKNAGKGMGEMAAGINSIAGAMQGMYEEGSRGYQNMAIAMQAANVIAAAGAVLQQGTGDPYTAFARMAAMAAAVASLGYSVGSMGGAAPDDAAIRQAQQGTGTVLGDTSAKSESIANAVEKTAMASEQLVGLNRGMLSALLAMQAGISGASVRIAQGSMGVDYDYGGGRTAIAAPKGIFDYGDMAMDGINGFVQRIGTALSENLGKMNLVALLDPLSRGHFNGVAGLVGKMSDAGVLGDQISKMYTKGVSKVLGGKSKVTDQGVEIVGGTLSDMIDETMIRGYETTRTQKNRWASWKESTGYFDFEVDPTDPSRADPGVQFREVFEKLADSVYEGAIALGLAGDEVAASINSFVIETQKISLKDLTAEEQAAEIEAVFSALFDNLAGTAVEFLQNPGFQKAGEGLGETLARVAMQVQVTEEAVFRLGFAADKVDPEQFAGLSVYLTEAAGGMEQFISSMGSFVDNFAPESHKLDLLAADMERSLAKVGLSVPSTRDEMWQLMQTLDAGTEAGAEQVATLLRLTGTADAYYKMLESGTGSAAAAVQKLSQALQDFVRNTQNGTQSLQMQLLQMQGNTEAIRNAERAKIQSVLDEQLSAAAEQENILAEQRAAALAAEIQLVQALTMLTLPGVELAEDQIAAYQQQMQDAADALGTLGAGSGDFAEQMQTLQNEMQSAEKASAEYLAAQEAIWREQDAQAAAQIAAAIAQQRAQLQMQELQLLGDLEAIRAAELTQIHESNQAIQQRIWAVHDAQAAEQQAAAVAEKRFDLENQLLRLQGNELAAVAREREKELDALRQLSPELVELQQQIWAVHDAVQGDDGLDKYLQKVADFAAKELARIEKDYQERIKLAEEQMRIGRELRQYVEQLRISELSPYDPGEKLELATEQFAALLVKAENGDMEAARLLQSSAQAYLQNADAYYGRSDPYLTIFEEVTRSMDRLGLDIIDGMDDSTLERINQQMLTEQQRIRDYAEQELRWAQDQAHALTGIQGLLDKWPDQFDAMFAGFAGELSQAIANAQPARPTGGGAGVGVGGGSGSGTGGGTGGIAASASFYDRAIESGYSAAVAAVWDRVNDRNSGALEQALVNAGVVKPHGSHKTGLQRVPFDGYVAELHKDERVLTAGEAQGYNRFNSDAIVAKLDQLCAENAALRSELAEVKRVIAGTASKAETQRDRQLRAALKTPEVI